MTTSASMTPDLTITQFIQITTTLARVVLVAFFSALIAFTYQQQIHQYLQQTGLLVPDRNPYNFR